MPDLHLTFIKKLHKIASSSIDISDGLFADLHKLINKQLQDKNYVGNYNLYQSDYDLHSTQNQTLKTLFGYIGNCIAETVKFANKNQIEKIIDKSKKLNVRFNETWFIRYNKEGFIFNILPIALLLQEPRLCLQYYDISTD